MTLRRTLSTRERAAPGPLLFVTLLSGALAGESACSSRPDPETLVPRAKDAVMAYFDAASRGDCPALIALRNRPMTPAECEDHVHVFQGSRTRLVSIEEAKIDGRDRSAVLVSTKLTFGDKGRSWLLRVECADVCKVAF